MSHRTLSFVLGGLLIAVAIAVTTGVFVWRATKRTVVEQILTPHETSVDLTTVVMQVRELHRLETASMHVIHVGRVSESYRLIPNALAGDQITFLAAGDVIAGIDLSLLRADDVWHSPDGTVNIRLPPAEILVSRVDNEKSRVLHRDTGFLRRADIDLETRARQNAEANIRREALKNGILRIASQNAEKKLAELIHTLGFRKVRFVEHGAMNTEHGTMNTER